MDVAFFVSVSERVERLRDNTNRVAIRQAATLGIGQPGRVGTFYVLTHQVDGAVVRAAGDKANDIRMVERFGDFNLAHEAAQRLTSDGDLRLERFDGECV